MRKLPSISGKLALKALMKAGYQVDHQTGSHIILRHVEPPHVGLRYPIIKNWPKGVEIYVLFLLAYELTSVARKKILRHPQPKEKGFEALEIGLSLDINWT